jgi:hypothetical protein
LSLLLGGLGGCCRRRMFPALRRFLRRILLVLEDFLQNKMINGMLVDTMAENKNKFQEGPDSLRRIPDTAFSVNHIGDLSR